MGFYGFWTGQLAPGRIISGMTKKPGPRPNPFKGTATPTPLADWLEATNTSIQKLALGVRASYHDAHSWVRGRQLPGLIYAFRIDEFTRGGVPVSSWLGTELGKWRYANQGCDNDEWLARKAEYNRRYYKKMIAKYGYDPRKKRQVLRKAQ